MKTTRSHVGAGALARSAERISAVLFAVILTLVASGEAQSFNAARAMQYTREIVAFGPRPIGSSNHKKLEN